ncbi:RNAse P Rpr2/Rpp21/SNM1 subunit domain-containing protein [Paraphoma chrysanthemicola]|uniref:RNAse P Rpr2/Rpp21/SNM1 subunit domain-containing protein n=1 Tax=Paraphoma chrysanthemicola TaxID=798071 RepID=A0A8K0RAI2_9PLEO|nr:RNAse P Rpr2/Rpp21/SNM1 subunit domain-containing protein [Paraphoma chrysanthemicola]
MSKVKPPKSKGIPSRHLHARTTFLYQAATYLTLQTAPNVREAKGRSGHSDLSPQFSAQQLPHHSPLALQLGMDLQQVSRKAQLRLSVDLKRTICKACNTILVPGSTATHTTENMSRGAAKTWADVLVIKCLICGGQKRFPVGAKTQPKKRVRKAALKAQALVTGSSSTSPSGSAPHVSSELSSIAAQD